MNLLEAKSKIEAWCAYQERCQFEVANKLREWNVDQEHVDIIIADLIQNRFVDELRFATAYASGKFRIKHWGRNKIKFKLKGYQISDYSIRMALSEIEEEEYLQTLTLLAERKLAELKSGLSILEKKAKIYNFLSSKGYESDSVFEIVKKVLS